MTAQERLAALSTPMWTLAALAASVESGLVAALDEPREVGELAERTGLPVAVASALVDVLATMDLAERDRRALGGGRRARAGDARAAARRAARRPAHDPVAGPRPLHHGAREPHALGGWRHTDEDLLQAQGRLSASVIPMLADVLFPHVPGLLDRLEGGSGAFLDVGAGVAAVSIAMCRHTRRCGRSASSPRPRRCPRAAQRRGRRARGPRRAARPARRGARRRGGLRRGLAAGELPPRRRLRHRA